jgi:hypothetical protein
MHAFKRAVYKCGKTALSAEASGVTLSVPTTVSRGCPSLLAAALLLADAVAAAFGIDELR